jgi:hypothetical protein
VSGALNWGIAQPLLLLVMAEGGHERLDNVLYSVLKCSDSAVEHAAKENN